MQYIVIVQQIVPFNKKDSEPFIIIWYWFWVDSGWNYCLRTPSTC